MLDWFARTAPPWWLWVAFIALSVLAVLAWRPK